MTTSESNIVVEPMVEGTEQGFKWTEELKNNLLETMIMQEFRTLFFTRNENINAWYSMRVFSCYLIFCKKAFNGNPPAEFTLEEFERKMLMTLPIWVEKV